RRSALEQAHARRNRQMLAKRLMAAGAGEDQQPQLVRPIVQSGKGGERPAVAERTLARVRKRQRVGAGRLQARRIELPEMTFGVRPLSGNGTAVDMQYGCFLARLMQRYFQQHAVAVNGREQMP